MKWNTVRNPSISKGNGALRKQRDNDLIYSIIEYNDLEMNPVFLKFSTGHFLQKLTT